MQTTKRKRYQLDADEKFILRERVRLGSRRVEPHEMPQAMVKHISKRLEAEGIKLEWWQRRYAGDLLNLIQRDFSTLFDHVGSSKLPDGRESFVCEPYGHAIERAMEQARHFAGRFGLQLLLGEPSWWHPQTVRFEFVL